MLLKFSNEHPASVELNNKTGHPGTGRLFLEASSCDAKTSLTFFKKKAESMA